MFHRMMCVFDVTVHAGRKPMDVSVCLLFVLLEAVGQNIHIWSRWSSWSQCSATCGTNAVSTRKRTCIYGTCPLEEPTQQSQSCFNDDCCARTDKGWGPWSKCSKERGCTQQRGRLNCSTADPETCPCYYHSRACTAYPGCCAQAHWLQWQEWKTCSTECKRKRGRGCRSSGTCVLVNCPGNGLDFQPCTDGDCCETAKWAKWNKWTTCSLTCGQGTRSRQRTCKKANCTCTGKAQDTEQCARQCCSNPLVSEEGVFGSWSSCSVTCGQGVRSRTLTCGTDVLSTSAECLLHKCEEPGAAKSAGLGPIAITLIAVSSTVLAAFIAVIIFISYKRRKHALKDKRTLAPLYGDEPEGLYPQPPLPDYYPATAPAMAEQETEDREKLADKALELQRESGSSSYDPSSSAMLRTEDDVAESQSQSQSQSQY